MATLQSFLDSLGLAQYLQTFHDEEITDVDLLKSMGDEMLRESMDELGMESAHVDKLSRALFGGEESEEEGLALEGNDEDDDEPLALEDNPVEAPAAAPPVAVPAQPVVSEASNGREALALLREKPGPDATLLDLKMDGMGGLDVLRRRGSASSRVICGT